MSSEEIKENDIPEQNDVEVIEDAEVIDDVEIVEDVQLIEELKKQNAELQDRLMRSLAEFDNFRKRTIKEKSQMFTDGIIESVEKFLPVVDNFERAINSFADKDDSTYKGFTMILKQMETAFKDLGVERIDALGQKFDTNFHYAVSYVEDDTYSENEVVQEMQAGYKYKDRVIRCSMVKVAN